jgi:hypothetical protein
VEESEENDEDAELTRVQKEYLNSSTLYALLDVNNQKKFIKLQ